MSRPRVPVRPTPRQAAEGEGVNPCAYCGSRDYRQPRPPFRHAGYTTLPDGRRFHFDCEDRAAKEGWFGKLARQHRPDPNPVTSKAKKARKPR